jgi:hypothetical protein
MNPIPSRCAWQTVIDEHCVLRIGMVHPAPLGWTDFVEVGHLLNRWASFEPNKEEVKP